MKNQEVIQRFLAGEDSGPLTIEELGGNLDFSKLSAEQRRRYHNPLTEEHKADLLIGQVFQDLIAETYDLSVEIGPKHQLSVTGTILLKYEGEQALDRFPLSLRHLFEVQELKVNGGPAAVEWEAYKDVFWVKPAMPIQPKSAIELSIRYAGTVDDWHLRIAHDPEKSYWERRAFVDQDRLFLPSYYGWYPYPGNDRIAEWNTINYARGSQTVRTDAIHESRPDRHPANFRVKVEASGRMELAANADKQIVKKDGKRQTVLFEAEDVRGFNLLGGALAQWSKAEALIDQLHTRYQHLADVIKLLDPEVRMPKDPHFIRADYPGMVDRYSQGGYSIDHSEVIYFDYMVQPARLIGSKPDLFFFDEQLLQDTLFALDPMSNERYFLRVYILNAISEYIQASEEERETNLLFHARRYMIAGSEELQPIYTKMNEVYAAAGHAEFLNVIQEMYAFLMQGDISQDPSPSKADSSSSISTYTQIENDFIAMLDRLGGEWR